MASERLTRDRGIVSIRHATHHGIGPEIPIRYIDLRRIHQVETGQWFGWAWEPGQEVGGYHLTAGSESALLRQIESLRTTR